MRRAAKPNPCAARLGQDMRHSTSRGENAYVLRHLGCSYNVFATSKQVNAPRTTRPRSLRSTQTEELRSPSPHQISATPTWAFAIAAPRMSTADSDPESRQARTRASHRLRSPDAMEAPPSSSVRSRKGSGPSGRGARGPGPCLRFRQSKARPPVPAACQLPAQLRSRHSAGRAPR